MSDFNHNRGVCVGLRDYQTILDDNKLVEGFLESGCRLRTSDHPIRCSIIISAVYDGGASSHWNPCEAIIPPDGIDEEGYVKEVWVQKSVDEIDLGTESLKVISAFVHKPDERILAFALGDNNSWDLLPSPEIVVRYYLKT